MKTDTEEEWFMSEWFISCLILMVIITIICSIVGQTKKEQKCRQLGGVPVYGQGGINCALTGFVEL